MIIDKFDALCGIKNTNIRKFAMDNGLSQPNLSQKSKRNSFYLKEGIMLAEYVGLKLAFVDADGKTIVCFDINDLDDTNK